MICAVIDTNVLVSSLINSSGTPARVTKLVLSESVAVYTSKGILDEYYDVLNRPDFHFSSENIQKILRKIEHEGVCIVPHSAKRRCSDPSDQKFYDTAKTADAYLVTGNKKHYPDDPCVVSPVEFLELI